MTFGAYDRLNGQNMVHRSIATLCCSFAKSTLAAVLALSGFLISFMGSGNGLHHTRQYEEGALDNLHKAKSSQEDT